MGVGKNFHVISPCDTSNEEVQTKNKNPNQKNKNQITIIMKPAGPYAQLHTINFPKLLDGDANEVDSLSKACREDGFFYLDLTAEKDQGILKDWKTLLPWVNDWLNQPVEEKMKYHHGKPNYGYTPLGTYTGIAEGTKDGKETIKITKYAFENPSLLPTIVNDHMEEFTRFNDTCRSITIELLKHLSDILGLSEGKRLEDAHREGHASNSCLNLIRYERGTDSQYFGLNKHTDNGTLTLLLTDQWGLQVLSKETEEWEFVEPKPGHAVINVADTLRFLSGLQFRSAVHRAEPIWEEGQTHRFSFGYFLRAEDEHVFPTLNGEVMTAKEWHDRKYTNYQAPHSVQNENHILLGGMEQLVATS